LAQVCAWAPDAVNTEKFAERLAAKSTWVAQINNQHVNVSVRLQIRKPGALSQICEGEPR
jgi:hypothetical protein